MPTKEEDKKLAKFFIPTLNISEEVILTFDQFKTINYNAATALFNSEKFVETMNIMYNNTLPIMNLEEPNEEEPNEEASPPGLFDLLIAQQIITGNKLSGEEKARMNIYIFGNKDPDYELFKNGDILNKLFTKLNGGNLDIKKKTKNILWNPPSLSLPKGMAVSVGDC